MHATIQHLEAILHDFNSNVPSKSEMMIQVEAMCLFATVLGKQHLYDQAQDMWRTSLACLGSAATISACPKPWEMQWLSIIRFNLATLYDRELGTRNHADESFRCCIEASSGANPESSQEMKAYVCVWPPCNPEFSTSSMVQF